MDQRFGIDTGDLGELAKQIREGSFEVRAGCFLEVSSFTWNNNDARDREAFIQACQASGVPYEVVSQIGRISWVCPEKSDDQARPASRPQK